jgi:hypothetical protein
MRRLTRDDGQTPRRQFIGELAAGAAALAAVACVPDGDGPRQTPPPQPASWNTAWQDRITAKHRAVFDSPEINGGTALYHAQMYLRSVKDVFGTGDHDASVVVVLRHSAVPLLFNDAMWQKYEIGKETKTLDSKSKEPVTRNIYYQNLDAEGKPATNPNAARIKQLSERGVIFIGCDLATRGFTSQFARATSQEWTAVYNEVMANLVPGTIMMPTGIFGMLLAQECGCSLMRST